jgi:hypothetical protein
MAETRELRRFASMPQFFGRTVWVGDTRASAREFDAKFQCLVRWP